MGGYKIWRFKKKISKVIKLFCWKNISIVLFFQSIFLTFLFLFAQHVCYANTFESIAISMGQNIELTESFVSEYISHNFNVCQAIRFLGDKLLRLNRHYGITKGDEILGVKPFELFSVRSLYFICCKSCGFCYILCINISHSLQHEQVALFKNSWHHISDWVVFGLEESIIIKVMINVRNQNYYVQ